VSSELSAIVGFIAGALGTAVAVPLAIRVAKRTRFYDVPREYRRHSVPTPLLGGAALLVGWLTGSIASGAINQRLWIVVVCGAALWLIGTVDDRVAIAPKWRLLAELLAAIALVIAGRGWQTSAPGVVNVALTLFWTVGLVNAFNLMDNMDGACATMTVVCALGAGVLAIIKGHTGTAGMAFALAGGAAAFLRWNLARPAKIFLGDGGSMLAGFVVAALVMTVSHHSPAGNAGLLVGALLVGIPILDVALVTLSRRRRGVPLVTGGRDHLTHRIQRVARSPRKVALTLATAQLILCAFAIGGYELGYEAVPLLALVAFVWGVTAITLLDTPRWRPAGIAVAPSKDVTFAGGRAREAVPSAQVERS
jgi:UDP-GlcNAc:undecaprenyl-phosphate/decaprenyl-phosphate GlcNAc-1-phosphate transferase